MKRMWSRRELNELVKEFKKNINTLVDSDGHLRFIEGDINIEETTGVTKRYGHWSLSGSHLLFVLVLDIANGTSYTSKTISTITDIPKWIRDKLIPLFSTTIVPYTTFKAFKSDGTTNQNLDARLIKGTNDVAIGSYSFTASDDRSVRIEFNLEVE